MKKMKWLKPERSRLPNSVGLLAVTLGKAPPPFFLDIVPQCPLTCHFFRPPLYFPLLHPSWGHQTSHVELRVSHASGTFRHFICFYFWGNKDDTLGRIWFFFFWMGGEKLSTISVVFSRIKKAASASMIGSNGDRCWRAHACASKSLSVMSCMPIGMKMRLDKTPQTKSFSL